ncbi:MAG: DNA translocase FtsK 4TM domain-containing protein [Zavarzinella sp.]
MPENTTRQSWIRTFSGTVILVTLYQLACLVSQPTLPEPTIPGWLPSVLPAAQAIRNILILALGYGAFAYFIACIAIVLELNFHFDLKTIARRLIGWAVLVPCCCLAVDWYGAFRWQGPLVGPGGTLGAFIAIQLEQRFEFVGRIMLFSAGLVFGVVLSLDFLLVGFWILITRTGQWVEKAPQRLRLVAKSLFASREVLAELDQTIQAVSPSPVFSFASNPPPVEREAEKEPVRQPLRIPPAVRQPIEEIPAPPEVKPRKSKPNIPGNDLPGLELLDESPVQQNTDDEVHLRQVAGLLEKTFADFGLKVTVVGIHTGPVVTQYEIALETGLRVSRVLALSEDIALNLRVQSVRIVAPLPGRNTVGIEVPNERRSIVRLRELIRTCEEVSAHARLPMILGKDSEGVPLVYDLADMPHLLIAGRTGTGKSVCLNSIIISLLLTRRPEECRLLMIDPKQVELADYAKLPHLMHPVVTDNAKAEAILSWAVDKMEQRYDLLRRARVRNISSYNQLTHDEIIRRVRPAEPADADLIPATMPYIVIVIDEVGDLMMARKKEVEGHIIRLAQKSRAAGIHLILTTQRPTVDVITGLIKSNLPARICFQVADRSNSRVVLDEMGAEKLLGKGDMLFLQPNNSTILRAQGTYVSDQEILRVTGFLEVENPEFDNELLNLNQEDNCGDEEPTVPDQSRKPDALYQQAVEIVIREGRGSVSLLQRALGIGYGRAARLIDYMAEDGIVGTYNGAQAREVLLTQEQWDHKLNGTTETHVDDPLEVDFSTEDQDTFST